MPKPTANETEEHFMGRCIPIVEGEGKPHNVSLFGKIKTENELIVWSRSKKYSSRK